MKSEPVLKDVVLIGAGHAHVAVLRMFGMAPLPGARLTLITREVHTPYSGMLPGLIAGQYQFDEAHIDTAPLARFAGARLYQDEMIGLDLPNRRIICRDRPPVAYDLLSINTGSTPNTAQIPGANEHAIPVKPIDGFLGRFMAMQERVIARKGRGRIAVVGAGAGGVELMLSVAHRLRGELAAAGFDNGALSFVLVTDAADILPSFPDAFRAAFRQILASHGIAVAAGAAVMRVEPGRLIVHENEAIEADEVLWTTQARPAAWLAHTGLALDQQGFLKVEPTLRAAGCEEIFAAGDVIVFPSRTLPKSGVYAVRAGPVLADNIRRALTGRTLRPFRPQRDAMYLISTGERYAVGTRNGLTFKGGWVWQWKDWIDRRFMRRFNDLPEMATSAARVHSPLVDKQALAEISAMAMRCGGCGAKVGATVLSRALSTITPSPREDVIAGLDAPDDAALVDTGGEKISVQTVDYFRAMVDDPYTFGRIAANHALGNVYAMGAEPQSALAIATVPFGLEVQGRGRSHGDARGREPDPARRALRLGGWPHQRRSRIVAGLRSQWPSVTHGGVAQGRLTARRCSDPDQTARYRHRVGGRYAGEGARALGNGGLCSHGPVEPARRGDSAPARRACCNRRDRLWPCRPSH